MIYVQDSQPHSAGISQERHKEVLQKSELTKRHAVIINAYF